MLVPLFEFITFILQNIIAGIAYAGFSQHPFFCFNSSQLLDKSHLFIEQFSKCTKVIKLKFNLMSLGFNGQNLQVPSMTLNRVATVSERDPGEAKGESSNCLSVPRFVRPSSCHSHSSPFAWKFQHFQAHAENEAKPKTIQKCEDRLRIRPG